MAKDHPAEADQAAFYTQGLVSRDKALSFFEGTPFWGAKGKPGHVGIILKTSHPFSNRTAYATTALFEARGAAL